MFAQPLFIERPTFEKVAVTVKLPEESTQWAPHVLSELHRQAPSMQNFHAEIVLDRTEPNKGMGFGYIIAKPKTVNPLAAENLPSIKIPVFIKNWHLSPLDIFFDAAGRGFMMSERRIRDALTRPELAMGAVNKGDPVSDDIRDMLTPPWENVGQFYRGVNTSVKTASLLEQVEGTVDRGQVVKIAQWVRSPEGQAALWKNEGTRPTFSKALQLEHSDYDSVKTAEAYGPHVVQYRWDGGPMMQVKIAQPGGFAPQQGQVPAAQAAQQMSPEQQQQMAQQGQAVQAPPMQVMTPEEMESDDFLPVQTFGVYRVITVNNEQLMGWVFPFILSLKMEKVPQMMFTDGTNFNTQQQIVGVHVSKNGNLPNEQPQGRGFFYVVRNGKAFAFAPLDLQGEQQQPDGSVMYMANTILGGNPVQIMKVQGMRAAAEMGEGVYGIPDDVRWCGFKQQTNPLVSDPTQATQRASAYILSRMQQIQQQQLAAQQQAAQQGKKGQKKTASFRPLTGVIRATQDNTYSLSGNAFEKLAYDDTSFLDSADTQWLFALAGVSPEYTQEKLAGIHQHGGYLEIPCFREVHPPETFEVKTAHLDKFASRLNKFMAKHAAEIKDPMVADTLLALNFLSPRNITMFISYLPQLEMVSSQLTHLLVAARVGEQNIPEGACKEALRNLEDVITGLKMLAMQGEQQ